MEKKIKIDVDSADFFSSTLMVCCCFSDLSWGWFWGWMLSYYGLRTLVFFKREEKK